HETPPRGGTSSPNITRLEWLSLSGNQIRDNAVCLLVESKHTSNLRALDLSYNEIGDQSLYALADSACLRGLKELNVSRSKVGNRGIARLVKSEYIRDLEWLNLSDTRVSDEGVCTLAESEYLCGLKELYLFRNGISPTGALALSSSEHLCALEKLYLSGNEIGDEGRVALFHSAALGRLWFLSLDDREYSRNCGTDPNIAWDVNTALHQRTMALARLCDHPPNMNVIPNLLPLLNEESLEGALSLWTMRLLDVWDAGAYCIGALEARRYTKVVWEVLRDRLLVRGKAKRDVLLEQKDMLEDGLFD
ncbi:MAG: hypothetical protein AAGJ35_15880, partial [Myxococcota bacterium]